MAEGGSWLVQADGSLVKVEGTRDHADGSGPRDAEGRPIGPAGTAEEPQPTADTAEPPQDAASDAPAAARSRRK
jgi:hypothetical protein